MLELTLTLMLFLRSNTEEVGQWCDYYDFGVWTMTCNGEPGKAGVVPTLMDYDEWCHGCEVCHVDCENCGGTGRVPMYRHDDLETAAMDDGEPCTTHERKP